MKMLMLPIGKIRSRPIAEIAKDYADRLKHYQPISITVCRDEGEVLAKVAKGDFFIALDERGAQMSSQELANFLARHQQRGTKRMVLMIGGPEGLGKAVRERADQLLSLSRMTLPHEMAQAVLLEQLYRACTILKGEPYHK